MNLKIKEAGTARKIATISFDADEVTAKESEACREIAKVANIPGFRKGKAPIGVIRQKYSKELKDELNRKISTEAYEAVLADKEIRVYSILKIDPGELSANNPASVEVTIDIEPEFDLPEYEKFELTTHPVVVSEEDIQKELQSLCDQRASFDVVERKIEDGDYVKCSYEGKIGDDLVADLVPDKPMYGKQSNTWEDAGQAKGLGVDAIAKGIVGLSKDEKSEIEASFDKDFEVAPLAGKSVTYSVEIHEIREKKAPAPDSKDFLDSLKIESLEELKKRIEKDLELRKQQENQNSKRQQVTQKILELPDFPLPQQAVEDESKNIFQNHVQRALQSGSKQQEI